MAITKITKTNWVPTKINGVFCSAQKANEIIDELNTVLAGNLYQGTLTPACDFPAATRDEFWIAAGAGTIGASTVVETGDQIICITTTLGGATADADFIVVQKNMIACTAAVARTGTNNTDFVTAKTFTDLGFTMSSATLVALAGGTTEQLKLTYTTTAHGLTLTGTAVTSGYGINIISAIVDTTTRLISGSSSMTTAFTTAKTLYGSFMTHTSAGTDVDGALVAGHVSYLSSTALSKISYYGFKSLIVGNLTAAAGTQLIASYYSAPTATINSATTTLTGVHVDLSGVTNTASAAIYGFNLLGFANIGLAYGTLATPITLPVNPGATVAGQTINILHSAGAGNCDDLLASYCKIAVTGVGDAGLTIVGSAPRAYVGVTGGANDSVASAAYACQPWFKHEGIGAITAGSALSALCNVGADNFTATTINAGHFHITGAATVTGQFDGVMIEVYPGVTSIDSFLAMAADGSAAVPTAMRIVGSATVAALLNVDAVTASMCVAPNTSAINALTAKIAVKIITNTGTYWLPGFSCTDGTGGTFN
jgi:hypothetical protein